MLFERDNLLGRDPSGIIIAKEVGQLTILGGEIIFRFGVGVSNAHASMILANGTMQDIGSGGAPCPLISIISASCASGFARPSNSSFGRQAITQHTWTSPRMIRSARSRIAWNSARTAGARLSASRGSAVPKERVRY